MNIIKTKSFELAIYAKGDLNADKLAIVVPGRLDTKDYIHNTSLVDSLATKGFYALSFDPPGTWESPGSIELLTTTNYLKAINELIEHFDNKPTLLLGHSRGGATAILGTANPFVMGVVAIMPSYGPPSPPTAEAERQGFLVEYRDLPPGNTRTEEKKEYKLPMGYFKDGSKYNPGETLKKYEKPKLIVYGTRDEFNNPDKVKNIYQEIPEPKEIHEVNSVHDYRLDSNVVSQVNTIVVDFVGRLP